LPACRLACLANSFLRSRSSSFFCALTRSAGDNLDHAASRRSCSILRFRASSFCFASSAFSASSSRSGLSRTSRASARRFFCSFVWPHYVHVRAMIRQTAREGAPGRTRTYRLGDGNVRNELLLAVQHVCDVARKRDPRRGVGSASGRRQVEPELQAVLVLGQSRFPAGKGFEIRITSSSGAQPRKTHSSSGSRAGMSVTTRLSKYSSWSEPSLNAAIKPVSTSLRSALVTSPDSVITISD
jgi:hypothetical protein